MFVLLNSASLILAQKLSPSFYFPSLSPFLQRIHVNNSICDQLHNQATREGYFSERKSVQVLVIKCGKKHLKIQIIP